MLILFCLVFFSFFLVLTNLCVFLGTMVSVEMEADKGYDTGFPVLENWPRLSKGIKRQGKKKKSCSCFFFELCASLFYLSVSVSVSVSVSYFILPPSS